MSQATSDAVLVPHSADLTGIRFRLGLELRDPAERRLAPLLPARYVRIQVASPPPRRWDDSEWWAGLRVDNGEAGKAEFDPDELPTGRVLPEGTSPFGQPEPETLVLDEWLEVPAAPSDPAEQSGRGSEAIPANFRMADSGDVLPGEALHFISVPYPRPGAGGQEWDVARAAYYFDNGNDAEGLSFRRPVIPAEDGKPTWIAVSLDRFWPPGRESSDYIIAVTVPS